MKQFLYLIATDQHKGTVGLIIKPFLWILSLVYCLLTLVRKFLYKVGVLKKYSLSCPVISVGNITVGGTGKTPLVEILVKVLQSKGIQISILTRGYMEGRGDLKLMESDEASMLQKSFPDVPVLVGANRVKSAQTYLNNNVVDVFILDDGFQYRRLSRDIDIVVIDATNPWGNGHLLPRGILRESKNRLTEAHIFVLTRTDFGQSNVGRITEDLVSRNPRALIVETVHEPISFVDMYLAEIVDLEVINKKQVCMICGIGNPDSFAQTLIELGANINAHFSFMDHHAYTAGDIKRLVQSCQDQSITTIVTTEKDAVKLSKFLDEFPRDIQILTLKIRIMITKGEEQFFERINRIL